MPDPIFAEPRLAQIYDVLDGARDDLNLYLRMVEDDPAARTVLDVGCGTGVLGLALAARGIDVVGVDPAEASLTVARARSGAARIRWIRGEVADLPPMVVDVATMTANIAQVFTTDHYWQTTLAAIHARLRPGGRLLFETRRPEAEAWRRWNRGATHRRVHVPDHDVIETWIDVLEVALPLVRFRHTFVFETDGAVLTSDSTLRFRDEPEVRSSLARTGFVVDDVLDAPDRPGQELVFVARRAD